MKRLFSIIFSLALLGMAFTHQKGPENTPFWRQITYCNIGPLAAINFCLHATQAIQHAAEDHKLLEASDEPSLPSKQVKAAPKRLQILKRELCQILELDHAAIKLQVDKKHEGVSK